MSGSRKSRKSVANRFNPRAENDWSKDNSKFGQRMLEKMGWTKGQGIGRDNQGITNNIKLQLKFDNKGLGFQITDTGHLCEIEDNFAHLLWDLNSQSSPAKIESDETRKDNFNQNMIEHDAMQNLNLPSVNNANTFDEPEDNERYKIFKKKKRKKETSNIAEDITKNECTEQNVSSKLCNSFSSLDDGKLTKTSEKDRQNSEPTEVCSSSTILFDCTDQVRLEDTNSDNKPTCTIRNGKKLKKNSNSTVISSTGVVSYDCISQKSSRRHKCAKNIKKEEKLEKDLESNGICSNDVNSNRKHSKILGKEENTKDFVKLIKISCDNVSSPENSNRMITDEINSDSKPMKTFKKAKKRKETQDIRTNTDACSSVTTLEKMKKNTELDSDSVDHSEREITQYSLKRRNLNKQETNIELDSEEMDSKKRKHRKIHLEKFTNNCDGAINAITTTDGRVNVADDEFTRDNVLNERKKKNKRQKTLYYHSLTENELEKPNFKRDRSLRDQPTEDTGACSIKKTSEVVGTPNNSNISSTSTLPTSKIKLNIGQLSVSTSKSYQFATDDRKLSKAERIVLKARLIKKLRDETVLHDFNGSNLSRIEGYGNKRQSYT